MDAATAHDHPIRILLVEDDSHIGRIIEMSLIELGIPYEFTSAISAEDGLELWGRHAFDVLLTDYNLRGMNGLQLVEELRGQGFHVPTLLVTAYDSADLRSDVRRLHIDAYLPKPFFMDELVDTVRRLLQAPAAREVNGGKH
ncbi:response regulator [Oscillochloris sp. ZM17-4]|uniref:response regulator n=1 Tax=Oscillochloris sp. ZM17-4 TaxID=2866714 RepID=UPI001C739425|nr:response regulator [Oscillochloris sp. ZM17-4]MBX0328889.1 response regulator [Oscillochloris sp. ZM17-4]